MRERIEERLQEVEELREEEPDSLVYEDAEEKLNLLLFLYDLLDESRELDHQRGVQFENPEEFGFRYVTLRNALGELEMLGYIDGLNFYLGGNGGFQITDLMEYRDWVEYELEKVEERLGEDEEEQTEGLIEEETIDVAKRLSKFCSFVAEDGFVAFWENGHPSGDLKPNSEDIGRSQLMAYLSGIGTGYQVREGPSGTGRQDVIFIENPAMPVIIETKVLRSTNQDRYEEGIEQLKAYVENQETDTGYYVIFHLGADYEDKEFEDEGVEIIQRCVNLDQEAPTTD